MTPSVIPGSSLFLTSLLRALPLAALGFSTLFLAACEEDCTVSRTCEEGSGGAGGELGGGAGEGSQSASDFACGDEGELCYGLEFVAVSPEGSDETGLGTPERPFRSLGFAVAVARHGEKEVHLCSDGESFQESLRLGPSDDGLKILGGFSCSTFETVSEAAVIVAEGAAGHRIEGPANVELARLTLASPDAEQAGESSAALSAHRVSGLTLSSVRLLPGKGQQGSSHLAHEVPATSGADGYDGWDQGAPPEAYADVVDVRPDGSHVVNTQLAATLAPAVESRCGNVPEFGGHPGLPAPFGAVWVGAETLQGGSGTPAASGGAGALASSVAGTCATAAEQGADGEDGRLALSKRALGGWEGMDYLPASGASGSEGKRGGGGGGGSGGTVSAASLLPGAQGGAGGTGGCGGKGGAGGQGGGGSFGLVLSQSEASLTDVWIVAAAGGDGGAAQAGQGGGRGGRGGQAGASEFYSGGVPSFKYACPGGEGGDGGDGADGESGPGGPAIGIALIDASMEGEASIELPEQAALGGRAADSGSLVGQGAEGELAEVMEFD